tara:strand:- start:230 stop:1054 length:825 start_codon:yes stop_codon:yes gene_type:complete
MSTKAIGFPEIPPAGPWDSYVLVIIWLPLILRILFLLVPFRKAIKKLAPHTGWALKQLKSLPIRGFGLLALNEILAFMIPPILVLLVRFWSDPIGWQQWSEVSNIGGSILLLCLFIWIAMDMLRIGRVRRMLVAVEKHDVNKLRKVAETGLSVRSWLRKFGRKKDGNKPIEDESIVKNTGGKIAKSSLKIWGARALLARRLTPAGLLSSLAYGAAVEVARAGAEKASDLVDKKMQEEFDKLADINSRTLLFLFARDLLMGIIPLLILWLLPKVV